MNDSSHVMLRLLSEDAGLGAPVEARYECRRARKKIKFSAVVGACATAITLVASALIAHLG